MTTIVQYGRTRSGSGSRADPGTSAERSPRLVDPDVGHGHHALHGVAQAPGTDDRPHRRQHRDSRRLPRRAPHLPRRGPQVLRAGRGLLHLHHAGDRLHVHLRVHRGGRRRLHGGVGRPHRGDVPTPGDHRPFPHGPVFCPDPRRAGHRHLHGGDRLHDRLRGLRVRRSDPAQLRRGDRAAGALAAGAGQLGGVACRRGASAISTTTGAQV